MGDLREHIIPSFACYAFQPKALYVGRETEFRQTMG